MSPHSPENLVFEILVRRTGLRREQISPDHRLLHDLGIDGDDAAEIIMELSGKCGVDVSQFKFSDHFRGEPTLASLFRYLPGRKRISIEDIHPFYVRDLIEAARSGKL